MRSSTWGGVSAEQAAPGLARDGAYRHLDAASGGATDGDVEEDLPRIHKTSSSVHGASGVRNTTRNAPYLGLPAA